MTATLATITPVNRQLYAYSTGAVTALGIDNRGEYTLRVNLGGVLFDKIPPGTSRTYPLGNATTYGGYVVLVPVRDNATIAEPYRLGTQIILTTYGGADVIPYGSATQPGEMAATADLYSMDPYLSALFERRFPVRLFGAVGDGVTDDRRALQACLDACRICGGGEVVLPLGTFRVTTAAGGSNGTTHAALFIGSATTLRGAGAGASVIQLAAAEFNQASILHNYTIGGGDQDIAIRDVLVDGNAANQAGTTDAQYGCRFLKARRVRVVDCTFKDVYGTTDGSTLGPNGTAGEGFAQQFDNCADVSNVNCIAYATSANTATGFASNQCTNVMRTGCLSYGWGHGMGFTDWTSQNVQHTNCRAYLCGKHGFNLEKSIAATYTGCESGGQATSSGAYPFTNVQGLGNSGNGYTSLGNSEVWYVGCYGNNNGGSGLQHFSTPAGRVYVVSGGYSSNSGSGITIDSNQATLLAIIGAIRLASNASGAVATGTTPASMTSIVGLQSAPAVPASTVALTNPFPVAVMVNVTGGTVTAIAINGSTVNGQTSGWVRLGTSDTVTLTYSAVPSWQWFSAL